MKDYLLSFVTSKKGDVLYIHVDQAGLDELGRAIQKLKLGLAGGQCEHGHLFSEDWGGDGLTASMLEQERNDDCTQVHHVKLYAWTNQWKEKHKL